MTRTAAALSEHPLATHAVGEAAGALLEAGHGTPPDLLCVFVTGPQAGALEDVVRALRQLLEPRTTIGTTAVSVLGGSREVEEVAALSVFGLWADEPGSVRPVRITARPSPEGPELSGTDALDGAAGTLVLLADPFTVPVDEVLEDLARRAPGLSVVGGLASAARGPGGNRMVLDGRLDDHGAVGVLLDPSVPVRTVVSQGCRPIGDPLTVTRAERNAILELAGRPALERLLGQLERLPEHERALAAHGLHLGRVIDEHRVDFERGDFLIRAVLGGDREAGAVVVGDEVAVGDTVQFQVRDADAADEDLRALMAVAAGEAPGAGALVFTCNGRGSHLFGSPDHDASVISEHLGGAPVAGMFCAGELGPVGGQNFLHGFTASVALVG
jgi:small ligand-binding sensory domain FIST